MPADTANAWFAIGGAALGLIPSTIVPLIDRALARSDAQRTAEADAAERRRVAYGDFLACVDVIAVQTRSYVDMQASFSVSIEGANRELTAEENAALQAARQAGSRAILQASSDSTKTAIRNMLALLPNCLENPDAVRVADIERLLTELMAAMSADLKV